MIFKIDLASNLNLIKLNLSVWITYSVDNNSKNAPIGAATLHQTALYQTRSRDGPRAASSFGECLKPNTGTYFINREDAFRKGARRWAATGNRKAWDRGGWLWSGRSLPWAAPFPTDAFFHALHRHGYPGC
jgi:hypothetical protein